MKQLKMFKKHLNFNNPNLVFIIIIKKVKQIENQKFQIEMITNNNKFIINNNRILFSNKYN